MSSTKLSNADAAWLHMERPTNLMTITAVLWFDDVVDAAALESVLTKRLLEPFPKFRKRVVDHMLSGAHWEEVPSFAITDHIHRITLPAPGGRGQLQDFVSTLMSQPLDTGRPLWQLYIAESLGGGCALVMRIHHCIADGISLARVLLSLTDPAPDAAGESLPLPTPSRSQPHSSLWHKAWDAVTHPSQLGDLARAGVGAVGAMGKLLLTGADRPSCLTGVPGIPERAAWSDPVPLARIKAIGRAHGATVNDVLIAGVTGAIHHYLLQRHSLVDSLRAVIPVNLRPLDQPVPADLGNKFGLVYLDLPVGLDHPVHRLQEVKKRMDAIKSSPEAIIAYGVLQAIGTTPPQIERAIIDLMSEKATAVMTNVPGPRGPVYLAGKRVGGMMFFVPKSGHVGFGVSIFSYNQEVVLGLSTDAGIVDRPEDILAAFAQVLSPEEMGR